MFRQAFMQRHIEGERSETDTLRLDTIRILFSTKNSRLNISRHILSAMSAGVSCVKQSIHLLTRPYIALLHYACHR